MDGNMDSMSNYNGRLVEIVASVRQNFWLEHYQQGFPEDEIRRRWTRQYLDPLAPALGMPESAEMTCPQPVLASLETPQSTPLLQGPFVQSCAMERRRTDIPRIQPSSLSHQAPGQSRKRANSSSTGASSLCARHMSHRSFNASDLMSDGNLSGGMITRTASGNRTLPSVLEMDVKVFDPADWLQQNSLAPSSPRYLQPQSGINNDFSLGVATSFSQSPGLASPLSSSFTQSVPLTPQSAGLDVPTFFTPSMSRHESLAMSRQESLANGLNMFRIDSQMSTGSDYGHPRSTIHHPHAEQKPSKASEFNGCPAQTPLESNFVVPDQALSPFDVYLGPGEKQPGHTQANLPRTSNKQSAIETPLPLLPSAKRPLKPKLREGETAHTLQSGHDMIRIESENGVVEKCKIAKTSYNRPQKQKVVCPYCNRKEGFRGEHELRRHQKLLHSDIRTGWICVDASDDGAKLGSCKNCRSGKVYGAYYNAAAHLRRVHFHPKKDGRKARGAVSRAGKGGGDDPPMEDLKKWMKKVEVRGGAKLAPPSTAIEAPLSAEERDTFMATEGEFGIEPVLSFAPDDFSARLDISDITASTATLVPDSTAYPWMLEGGPDQLQQPLNFTDPEIFDFEPFA